ncbi:hypothetical protein B7486_03960 [cyanobacterium TDX16]|nr:hypothetical protein B7486_03960 [cyanobacterium TDX16]
MLGHGGVLSVRGHCLQCRKFDRPPTDQSGGGQLHLAMPGSYNRVDIRQAADGGCQHPRKGSP